MTAAPQPLAGRTIFVTGASSGLGARFVRQFSAAGAAVVAGARRMAALQALVEEVSSGGGRACAVPVDVTDEASVMAAFDAAEAAIGPIDSLVANAGINIRGLALDMPVDDFDRIMAVNLRGAFITAREAARRLIARGDAQRGRVLLVSSIGATRIIAGSSAYCASKGGIDALGRNLAREWARHGINVNMIAPGFIRTDINAAWFDEEGGRKQLARFPRRRLLEADQLDAIAIHLLSDAASGITGSSFVIDDGQTL